jgi:hypothetical protein
MRKQVVVISIFNQHLSNRLSLVTSISRTDSLRKEVEDSRNEKRSALAEVVRKTPIETYKLSTKYKKMLLTYSVKITTN